MCQIRGRHREVEAEAGRDEGLHHELGGEDQRHREDDRDGGETVQHLRSRHGKNQQSFVPQRQGVQGTDYDRQVAGDGLQQHDADLYSAQEAYTEREDRTGEVQRSRLQYGKKNIFVCSKAHVEFVVFYVPLDLPAEFWDN